MIAPPNQSSSERSVLQRRVDEGLHRRAYVLGLHHGKVGRLDAADENVLIGQYQEITTLARFLRHHSGDLLVLKPNSLGNAFHIPKNRVTLLVQTWLDIDRDFARKIFPHHKLHPWIDIFLEHAILLKECRHHLFDYAPLDDPYQKQQVRRINWILLSIKEKLEIPENRRRTANFTNLAYKNRLSIKRYVGRIIERYRNVCVVRIDLGYIDRAKNIDVAEIDNLREKLLRYLARGFPVKRLGYIWKLEHGLQSSYRYHFIFFFPVQSDFNDATLADMIGQYWASELTAGQGAYFSWNRTDGKLIRPGTGLINSPDSMQDAVHYLTKLDYFIKLIPPSGGRALDRGNLPRKSTGRRTRSPNRVSKRV